MFRLSVDVPREQATQWARSILGDEATDFRPTVFEAFQAISGSPDMAPYGWLLHALVRAMKPVNVVEIGTWCGYSTCWLAHAVKDNECGHVWSIDDASFDPARTPSMAQANLERFDLTNWATLVTAESPACFADSGLPRQIDFALIDGDHSYEGCKADIEVVLARLAPTGALAMHDTRQWEGVSRCWQELRSDTRMHGFDIVELPFSAGLGLIIARPKPAVDVPFTESDFPGGSVPPRSTKP